MRLSLVPASSTLPADPTRLVELYQSDRLCHRKERGVIREEWRTGQDAQMRLWQQQLPKMYAGSRYANRMPIGSIDVSTTSSTMS